MAFTDGGLAEPLILAVFLFGILGCGTWVCSQLARTAAARRKEVQRPERALKLARDALAAVISDSAVFGENREKALDAYEKVSDALKKEKSIT